VRPPPPLADPGLARTWRRTVAVLDGRGHADYERGLLCDCAPRGGPLDDIGLPGRWAAVFGRTDPRARLRSERQPHRRRRVAARRQDGAVLPSGRRPGDLPELITTNDNFYIVTNNAGGDPVLHPEDWRMVVDGEVQRPFELDYTALRKLPSIEITKSLECISNLVDKCQLAPFGCDLISTARWRGVRLADVLGLVGGVKPGADWVATIS